MMLGDRNAAHCDDTLGGRISLARETKAISIEKAAERLGVLPSSWNAWECDRDVPRANRLTMMAGVLGVCPSWLLAGVGEGPMEQASDSDRQDLRQAIRRMAEDVEALDRRMRQLSSRIEGQASASA